MVQNYEAVEHWYSRKMVYTSRKEQNKAFAFSMQVNQPHTMSKRKTNP